MIESASLPFDPINFAPVTVTVVGTPVTAAAALERAVKVSSTHGADAAPDKTLVVSSKSAADTAIPAVPPMFVVGTST